MKQTDKVNDEKFYFGTPDLDPPNSIQRQKIVQVIFLPNMKDIFQ
jgi:hypothetical protein